MVLDLASGEETELAPPSRRHDRGARPGARTAGPSTRWSATAGSSMSGPSLSDGPGAAAAPPDPHAGRGPVARSDAGRQGALLSLPGERRARPAPAGADARGPRRRRPRARSVGGAGPGGPARRPRSPPRRSPVAEVAPARPYGLGRQELLPLISGSATTSGGAARGRPARRRRGRPPRLAGPRGALRLRRAGGRRPGRHLAGLAGGGRLPSLHGRRAAVRAARRPPGHGDGLDLDRRGIELWAGRDWRWSGAAPALRPDARSGSAIGPSARCRRAGAASGAGGTGSLAPGVLPARRGGPDGRRRMEPLGRQRPAVPRPRRHGPLPLLAAGRLRGRPRADRPLPPGRSREQRAVAGRPVRPDHRAGAPLRHPARQRARGAAGRAAARASCPRRSSWSATGCGARESRKATG